MNILFVTPYYTPTSLGGIESQVKTISQSLSHSNNCVIIAPSKENETFSIENKVRVYRTKIVNEAFKEYADAARDYNFFEEIIKKEKINKIIAHNFHTWVSPITTSALLAAAEKNKIPVYLRVHNYCTKESIDILKSPKWKKYLCVSKSVAAQIISIGIDKENVIVLYCPIDTNNFIPNKDDSIRKRFSICQKLWAKATERVGVFEHYQKCLYFLRVKTGRVHKRAFLKSKDSILIMQASRITGDKNTFDEKGVASLLNIFSRLKDKNSHLLFCAAKTTAENAEEFNLAILRIKEIAKSLSVDERVHIISSESENMPKMYNNADIFIMLSKIETFGGVYAEAMACGLPVIGTNVGGIPEVIKNNETGFIVNSDEEALEKLNLLIENPHLRNKMGKAGIKHVKRNFNMQKITRELIRILNGHRNKVEEKV